MKVLVVNNAVPFIWGGAEELARNLVIALNATNGVSAELLPSWLDAHDRCDDSVLTRRCQYPMPTA